MDKGVASDDWRRLPSPYRNYEVSCAGAVRRGARELKGYVDRYGYRTVLLSYAGISKRFKVHRLVCEAFSGPCPDGLECAHLDGDPANNAASNLRWVTHKENIAHSIHQGTFSGHRAMAIGQKRARCHRGVNNPRALFTNEQVTAIRAARQAGDSYRAIGRMFNCNASTALKIVRGETYE